MVAVKTTIPVTLMSFASLQVADGMTGNFNNNMK